MIDCDLGKNHAEAHRKNDRESDHSVGDRGAQELQSRTGPTAFGTTPTEVGDGAPKVIGVSCCVELQLTFEPFVAMMSDKWQRS